jgi:hypothetical protein
MQAIEIRKRMLFLIGAGSFSFLVAIAAGSPAPTSAAYPRACATIEASGTSPRACQGIVPSEPFVNPASPSCASSAGEFLNRSNGAAKGRIGFVLLAH